MSRLILALTDGSQAVLILRSEERYKSCHTTCYDIVGVILSLVDHVKLELELAQPYGRLSCARARLCALVIASLLLASCVSSFIKCPFPVGIIHPRRASRPDSPRRSRGRRRWGGRSSRLSILCQTSPGGCTGTGGRGHCADTGCHLLSRGRDSHSAALGARFL